LSKHHGGGKFGNVQNSWPFVTLIIGDDSILMSTMLQDALMKRESIQAITLHRTFINYRFIFKHSDPSIKQVIEFWTFSPNPVKNALKSQGYSVSEDG
jgi:hypothetical protein